MSTRPFTTYDLTHIQSLMYENNNIPAPEGTYIAIVHPYVVWDMRGRARSHKTRVHYRELRRRIKRAAKREYRRLRGQKP